jgi:hypothetical protein
MNSIYLGNESQRIGTAVIDAQALKDAAYVAWCEARAYSIEEASQEVLSDLGFTPQEITQFAETRAELEAARGDWLKDPEDGVRTAMSTALIPFQEMESMAGYITKSGLFGAKNEAQAMSLMLLAQAEGMHPMAAIQDFDIVQGRPARKTHSILARFQAAGGIVQWEEISATRACGTFSHKQGGSLRVEWTFDQAKRVGLTNKDNWKNYPQAMLRARCIAEGVRAVYPGAIGGMLSVEEAQDVVAAPPRDMGQVEGQSTAIDLRSKWLKAVSESDDKAALERTWKDALAEIRPTGNMDLYHAVKNAVATRKDEIEKAPIDVEIREVMDEGEADLQAHFERQIAAESASHGDGK